MNSPINPDIYKDNLPKIAGVFRSKSFSEAVYENVDFFPYAVDLSVDHNPQALEGGSAQNQSTSREQTHDSTHERKLEEKSEPNGQNEIIENLDREKIQEKLKSFLDKKKSRDNCDNSQNDSLDSTFNLESSDLQSELLENSWKYKNIGSQVKVIFVFEGLILSETNHDDLLSNVLSGNAKEVFKKILKAMNLSTEEYLISWCQSGDEELDLVLKEIFHFKPTVVISLGSKSAQLLTKKSMHFTQIRKNKYHLNLNGKESQIRIPLFTIFNIDLLVVNPQLKRIAWEDLQSSLKLINQ